MIFEFRIMDDSYSEEIMLIQEETLLNLDDPDLLRRNTREMIESCLQPPNLTVGAFVNGELAGFGILYYPQSYEENLACHLQNNASSDIRSANFKLCIVREKYRGNSLQYELGRRLETEAEKNGTEILCSTVSPKNQYSRRNLVRLGYIYDRTLQKYGMKRELYCKKIRK